jgi:hypothetical protein
MSATGISRAVTAAVLLFGLCGTVGAQFSNFVTLPTSDFTWRWGDWEESRRRNEDFNVNGNEGGFRCELVGQFGPGSQLTEREVRVMEQELGSSLYFIQSAANAMNILDQQRDIEWAELACTRPPPTENDPEKSAERVERAREKALQEMLERRERRERNENR